ncbi:unnamed protein product [Parnassius apollo]|uniref:(apollo) hypothetical protein n=1 Tax=Parnassius apollo TaxID=110799 RepID=A0A8S3X7U7_PARAO|nr:unnamed protein product [Parnassius apollo]
MAEKPYKDDEPKPRMVISSGYTNAGRPGPWVSPVTASTSSLAHVRNYASVVVYHTFLSTTFAPRLCSHGIYLPKGKPSVNFSHITTKNLPLCRGTITIKNPSLYALDPNCPALLK